MNSMNIYWNDEVIRIGDDRKVIEAFVSCFTVVPAAGGVVKNERGEILFIFRRGKWDLPKGKVEGRRMKNEEGGTKDEGRISNFEFRISEAIREVKEETGLVEVTVVKELNPTYHIYYEKGKQILKETYWFEMLALGTQKLVPQTQEEITEVRWFKPEELDVVLENTFESLKEMIEGLRPDGRPAVLMNGLRP